MSKNERTSSISGFYKLPVDQRLSLVSEFASFSDDDSLGLQKPIPVDAADNLIENVVGVFELPLGIAVNFRINDKEILIPMVTEESSVVAAASKAAKIARVHGGFSATAGDPLMIGQIQLLNVNDYSSAVETILDNKDKILQVANAQDKILVDLGGGARELEVRILEGEYGKMIIVHVIVDVRDAMGANAVNTMMEAIAPVIEELTAGKVRLKILSNLADKRLVTATAVFDKETMGGEAHVDAFLQSYLMAAVDPYRAATHNKGIMNGIDAVIIATGNDFRAVEAGAHAYAARNGQYAPLTSYHKDEQGNLVGKIEIPMAIGIVGGVGNVHLKAKLCKKLLGVTSAKDLAEIIASVGIAQNFAAVFALSTVGIQKGHMSLHAKNIAMMAGATDDEIDTIADQLVKEGKVKLDRAKELLEELR